MSAYTIVSIVLSGVWLFLGLRAVLYDRRNRLYRLFGAICLSMGCWTLFLGISYSLENLGAIVLLLKIGYIGAFMFSPLMMHFYAEVSGIPSRPLGLALNYLPWTVLTVSNFIDFFIFSRFEKRDGEWFGILDSGNPWVRFYILICVAAYIASMAMLVRWNLRARVNKEKIQSRLLLVFFTATYFTSLVLTLILPYFGISDFEHFGIAMFDLYVVGLSVLISRFRFMNLHGGLPVGEVIANIDELVFILDRNLRVTDWNDAVRRAFPDEAEKLRNRSLADLAGGEGIFNEQLSLLANGKIRTLSTQVTLGTGAEAAPFSIYIAELRDRFGDYTGFLAIAREAKGIARFRKLYRLTKREMEIVGLSVSGVTYRDIAERLGISEKTVERHMTNIYNKIGISSKIDLFRIAGEYGLKA